MDRDILIKELIEYKYKVKGRVIDTLTALGTFGGFGYCGYTLMENKKPSEYLIGVGIFGASLLVGNYFSRKNDTKKQKELEKILIKNK